MPLSVIGTAVALNSEFVNGCSKPVSATTLPLTGIGLPSSLVISTVEPILTLPVIVIWSEPKVTGSFPPTNAGSLSSILSKD